MPLVKLPELPTTEAVESAAEFLHDPDNFLDVAEYSIDACQLLDNSTTVREKLEAYGGRKEYGPAFTNGFLIGYLVAMGWKEAD